ncbi:MAG: outer membrane protein assembly factor BamD [Nitrospirae bacterium]|nr:outer membrane protein assembly factor BamD [Nitrospirota bacterium]
MKYKKTKYVRQIFFLLILLIVLGCSAAQVQEPPFDPEGSLKKANDLISAGSYAEARELLEKIKLKDASQQYSTLAKLRIADTYFEDASYDEAAVEYETFLNTYPYSKYAPYAQYNLALSFFKRITTVDISYSYAQRALKEFEKLRRDYPRNPYMDIVDDRITVCRRVLAEYEFSIGNFYYKKGSYNAAVQRFTGLLENYPDSMKESETLYYLGLSYENLGQRDKAINALTSLIVKFPTIKRANDARELITSFKEKK